MHCAWPGGGRAAGRCLPWGRAPLARGALAPGAPPPAGGGGGGGETLGCGAGAWGKSGTARGGGRRRAVDGLPERGGVAAERLRRERKKGRESAGPGRAPRLRSVRGRAARVRSLREGGREGGTENAYA